MHKKKRGSLTPPASSIVIDLTPIFRLRGITQPIAYLLKIGINNTSAQKILQGKASQLNLIQLTRLCTALNCTPNDLYATRQMTLPDHHELHKLQVQGHNTPQSVVEFLQNKTLDEIKEILA